MVSRTTLWQIRITLGGYFAGDYSHTGGNHGFTGNMGVEDPAQGGYQEPRPKSGPRPCRDALLLLIRL